MKKIHLLPLTSTSRFLIIVSYFIIVTSASGAYDERGTKLLPLAIILLTLAMVSDFLSQSVKRPSKRK